MKKTVFICAGIIDQKLVSKVISSLSKEEAQKNFYEQYNINPEEILGPFFQYGIHKNKEIKTLKFSGETKKAVYNDWLVNAFLLKEPANQAYLIFIKRIDNKNILVPNETIVVSTSELRYL